ncbi:DUF6714 family protein [Noviherbaspirillum massiliense]|uniref:DUF6714 family protein n=1 Tax=Noviherbaspirillum massiliense TaxID=1465823 RepID=UPI0002D43A71|nr:DUF6714 family protein [Noviherbaspirillum massiliense]
MEKTSTDWKEAFAGLPAMPAMSLRGGDAVDEYAPVPPYDPDADCPTGDYFERYFWELPHLDADSWRYYLPFLLEYALENIGNSESNAVDAFLFSLRPPDRDPPRFGALSLQQDQAVVAVLDRLAFVPESVWKEPAMTALEEYWGPGAIHR